MTYHLAYIAVGSNLGDRLENCRQGLDAIEHSGKSKIQARSKFYQTAPVDYQHQDWFINAAVCIETQLEPFSLLQELKSIEKKLGRRTDGVRFGPRLLDLDIIFYNNRVFETAKLKIPHPRAHKRRFVLKPICDIDPNILHPMLNKNVQALLDELDDADQKVIEFQCDY